MSSTTQVLTLSAALFSLFVVGCGDDQPPLGEVSGVVTLDGKPLPKARIVFQPLDRKSPPSSGTTDDQGRYVLHYNRNHDGAWIGKHQVRITSGRRTESGDGGKPIKVKERVPAKYNVNSELEREVTRGRQEIDFQLEGKGKIIESEG
ncbi:MAG TPA: carboxypeptidase regulatory-like domain-containing protein [Pirellulales bacterium]